MSDTGGAVPNQSAHKAVASGVVSTAVAFLTGLSTSIEGGVTSAEWVAIALATVLGAAAGFGITYRVPNRAK